MAEILLELSDELKAKAKCAAARAELPLNGWLRQLIIKALENGSNGKTDTAE